MAGVAEGMDLTWVTLGDSVVTGYCKTKDKKKIQKPMHKGYTPLSECFLQGFGLAVLKLLYVYTRTEQISKYFVAKESQIFHCQRKRVQIGKGED